VRVSLFGGAVLLGMLVSSVAAADRPARPTSHLTGKQGQDFWGWLMDPHKTEVDDILRLARDNWQQAAADAVDFETGSRSPGRAERRRRLLSDAEGMLKHALKLAPGRAEVLRELALVQDENDVPAAQESLERYLAAEIPERVSAEPRVRLGRWYARQRRFSDATVQLRLALGSPATDPALRAQALHLYATVLMHSDRLAEAIDLLKSASQTSPAPQTVFALAVAYDRDEQITRALETLEGMRAMSTPPFADVLIQQENRRPVVFVPPWERHYYAALQYELLGFLPEARSEWQAYIRCDEAPYRERARQHLALVDRLAVERAAEARRAANRAARKKPAATTTPPAATPPVLPGGAVP
jgi:tetratricopeptide (TPR) repeat protein